MKHAILSLILCLLALFIPACAEVGHEVLYFYENYCESCSPEEDFASEFRALTGMNLNECAFEGHNIAGKAGKEALETARTKYGIKEVLLPLVIVDGTVYAGSNALKQELPQEALEWSETTDSVIVYLYVPACESCGRVAAVLDALPDEVIVRRGMVEFESRVRVERVDVSAETALAESLFEAYQVPDEKRITPCVFFSDRYLSGAEGIERDLSTLVRIGRAAGGIDRSVVKLSSEAQSGKTADVLMTLGAGIVAGLNTCALSMLLLFLSAMLEAGRRAGLLSFCFLAAKFVCYLLIGFALLGVLQQFNPQWLRPLARGILTALGAVLIALNLWDAWQIHQGNYGKVRNQLPAGMRGGLRRTIRALTASRVLIPAAVALGFIVALGEFLCAGQIYLIQLMSAVQTDPGGQTVNLVLYCLAFIAPSAAISTVVLKGCSQARVSTFFADHQMSIKLLTALMMLLLTALAWMI